jgi:hypothetical protein
MQYMASDPFNDRFKVFTSDYSHNIPTNTGVVYEFKNKRAIVYNDFQRVCYSIPLEDKTNTFKFFESMEHIWSKKTKYLGKVKIRFGPESN